MNRQQLKIEMRKRLCNMYNYRHHNGMRGTPVHLRKTLSHIQNYKGTLKYKFDNLIQARESFCYGVLRRKHAESDFQKITDAYIIALLSCKLSLPNTKIIKNSVFNLYKEDILED